VLVFVCEHETFNSDEPLPRLCSKAFFVALPLLLQGINYKCDNAVPSRLNALVAGMCAVTQVMLLGHWLDILYWVGIVQGGLLETIAFTLLNCAVVVVHVRIVSLRSSKAASDRAATESLADPAQWPGLGPLEPAEEERVLAAFREACSVAGPQLEVERVLAIDQAGREPQAGARLLYHGTAKESARAIAEHGFKLPEKGGMFGKAVYFASAPTKSWFYAIARAGPGDSKVGLIFGASIALGHCVKAHWALPNTTQDTLRSFGGTPYDSVMGLSKSDGGVLRHEEFAVYDPERCVPRYLFVVRSREQSP
jgi:hypothetical protein